MAADAPPVHPKMRKLYESALRLAYLRAEMEKTRKAAAGLDTIMAAMRAHRGAGSAPPSRPPAG